MDFLAYYRTLSTDQRRAFAHTVGTTPLYLRNIAYGQRQANDALALAIEQATAGAVTVAELRPDLAAALEAAGYRRDPDTQEAA